MINDWVDYIVQSFRVHMLAKSREYKLSERWGGGGTGTGSEGHNYNQGPEKEYSGNGLKRPEMQYFFFLVFLGQGPKLGQKVGARN